MKQLLLLTVCLSLLSIGASFDAQYLLNNNANVTYTVTTYNEQLVIPLPSDAEEVTINGEQVNEQQAVTVNGSGTTVIEFVTNDPIEKGATTYFVEDFTRIQATLTTLTVKLPKKALLVNDLSNEISSVKPLPDESTTDGSRIIFKWQGRSLQPANAVLIEYQEDESTPWMWIILVVVLALAIIAALAMNNKRQKQQAITRNLYDEELEIVNILKQAENGELWQKELTNKVGFSKVKVSRKLRNLESKGVIEKIPVGNTNKIRLKENS